MFALSSSRNTPQVAPFLLLFGLRRSCLSTEASISYFCFSSSSHRDARLVLSPADIITDCRLFRANGWSTVNRAPRPLTYHRDCLVSLLDTVPVNPRRRDLFKWTDVSKDESLIVTDSNFEMGKCYANVYPVCEQNIFCFILCDVFVGKIHVCILFHDCTLVETVHTKK